jgi:hypothetical protein
MPFLQSGRSGNLHQQFLGQEKIGECFPMDLSALQQSNECCSRLAGYFTLNLTDENLNN